MIRRLLILVAVATPWLLAPPVSAQEQGAPGRPAEEVAIDPTAEGPQGVIGLTFGYSSDQGATAGVSARYDGFLADGQSLRFAVTATDASRRAALTLRKEAALGQDRALELLLRHARTEADSSFLFDTQTTAIEPRLDWTVSPETTVEGVLTLSRDGLDNPQSGLSALVLPDVGTRNRAGMGVLLRHGPSHRVLEFGQSFDLIEGGRSQSRTTLALRLRGQAWGGAVLWSARARAGHLSSNGGPSHIGDRFVLGGSALRGFANGGFGPRDLVSTGQSALGGNSFALLRLDASFPRLLAQTDRVVPGLHLDLGSLWGLDETSLGTAGSVDDSAHLRSTLGLTLRADLGAGSLNLNLSYPIREKDYDRTQILQLGFEAAF